MSRAALLWLLVTAGVAAQEVSGSRQFGPLNIGYTIADGQALTTLVLSLEGVAADKATLTYEQRIYTFKVAAGGARAEGSIRMTIAQAPNLSNLEGHFTTWSSSAEKTLFDGKLTSWIAPDSLILTEQNFWLTGSLSTRTTIRNNSRSGAVVDILSGNTVLFSTLLLPPSTVAVIPTDLVIGSVKVEQGAKMTLTPPSSLADGTMFLECQFQSDTTPSTNFSGTVAIWTMDTPNMAAPPLVNDNDSQ
jgi:hypothetical protein